MIPYEIDPSLHTAEPEPDLSDDGFSPPHHDERTVPPTQAAGVPQEQTDSQLPAKNPS